MKETDTYKWFFETNEILSTIRKIKSDLVKAISLLGLNLNNKETLLSPSSFLDFAILMALYYLQLYFVERFMSSEKKFKRKLEDYIFYDRWTLFQRSKADTFDEIISKVLNKIKAFDKHQIKCANNDPTIFSQDYANEYRRGMRVINGG